jgi:heme/copper-type cytochrome/quinol oxidase subunit 1
VPRFSVVALRSALVYLATGFTIGALLLFHKGVPLHPGLWRLLPVHNELLVVGWTLNLALGVAYWILPRFLHGAPRGDTRLVWLAFFLLNGGVLAMSLAAWAPSAVPDLGLAGRTSQAAAALIFALQFWPRIKPYGR